MGFRLGEQNPKLKEVPDRGIEEEGEKVRFPGSSDLPSSFPGEGDARKIKTNTEFQKRGGSGPDDKPRRLKSSISLFSWKRMKRRRSDLGLRV